MDPIGYEVTTTNNALTTQMFCKLAQVESVDPRTAIGRHGGGQGARRRQTPRQCRGGSGGGWRVAVGRPAVRRRTEAVKPQRDEGGGNRQIQGKPYRGVFMRRRSEIYLVTPPGGGAEIQ